MSTGIDPIDSAPLIIRTYNDDSADNTFLLTRYDYPVSSNYVLRTSANGELAPSDAITQTTMGMSSMTISNHFGSTMVYDTFSSGTLFLPSGVFNTITKTTMTASSVTASTIFLNVLNICTMNASTFSPNGVTVAYTTLGSTVQTSSVTYSTLMGDSLFVTAGFVSTLFGSSIHATSAFTAAMASDTSRLSTLTMDSTIVGFLSFSTLQGNTLVVSTLSGSSIYTNPLTVSTLDGGSLIMSTITCLSTLSVSSLYASGLAFSTTTGSSVVMSTVTAPLLFSHSLSFSTAQGSTVTVSSATVSSLYTSLLVGSTLQTNTLVFSTLMASSIHTSNLSYSTVQGSTMLVSTIGVSTLVVGAFAYSTLSGSSISVNTILLSTLTGSTISWNRVVLSTLQGPSAIVSSVTASTVLGNAVVAASLQGSTMVVSTAAGSSLNTSFVSASTIVSDSLFFSTLSVSTLISGSAVYSTLQGSTTTLSTLTASTLSVSTTMASTINGSSLVGSTLTASTIQSDGIVFSTLHGSTLLLSTLTSCTINVQTIRVSTLQGSMVSVSTLAGSTIVSDQLTYSTLIGSTIVTDYITATSTCTGNGTLHLSTVAFSTQQTTTAFLNTLIVTSTLTVSTLNRINPTSLTASTLSGRLQANTATGLLTCSSLTVNAMNLSRSIVNQPVYGNTVKMESVVASGQSLVRTSGIRATIDQMPSSPQTYTFGAALPNRWVAAANTTNNVLSYSNDGFNWVGAGSTILGNGRNAIWNGFMWVAVGDAGSYNSIAYSYDGIKWTGLGSNIFTNYGLEVAWNGSMWVAVGGGTNSIAYSYDGINWSGLGNSILSTYGHAIVWNGSMWVATGIGSDSLAYSYDGISWTGLGTSIFSGGAFGVAWNGHIWVAVGSGGNTIAYSYNGVNWVGLGNILFSSGTGVAWNGTMWVAVGGGTNSIAYSYDGINWTGEGTQGTVPTRYIRFEYGDASTSRYLQIAEVRAYTYAGINIITPSTTVTSSYVNVNNPASFVVDGNNNTFYHSDLATSPWLEIDLGSNQDVYKVEFVNRPDCCRGRIAGARIVLKNTAGTVVYTSNLMTLKDNVTTAYQDWPGNEGYLYYTWFPGTSTTSYGSDSSPFMFETSIFSSVFSSARRIAWNGNMWLVAGNGINNLAYSYNGINWTGLGNVFGTGSTGMSVFFNSARPHRITFPSPMTVATGSGTNTLAYSPDGVNWTGNGLGIFSTQGNGVATNGSMWVATGSGTNTLAYSTTDIETPYIYLPFENGLYADVMGNSTITVTGSPAFVTGPIGSKAVNIVNTAGSSTASQYLDGNCILGNNFSVSLWFKFNTLPATDVSWSSIITLGSPTTMSFQIIYLTLAGHTGFYVQYMHSGNALASIVGRISISTGVWYQCTAIFQGAGMCSVYLNNMFVGSNPGGGLYTPITNLRIGYNLAGGVSAFDGQVDDVRIYNYAIAVNPRITWRGLGTSVFSTQGKGVAWNGSMWVAVGSGTNSIAYSYDGVTWIGLGVLVLTQGNAVAWSGSMWVAVGSGTNSIAYSYDGITWTGSSFSNTQWNGVAWNGSMWVAVGSGPHIMAYSYDGINWTSLSSVFVPSAYLPLENSFADTFGSLTSPTMVGSVTYSTSIRKVGTYSAYFANSAGSDIATNYLTYATPSSFYNPTAITVSFWMYPTAYASSALYKSSVVIDFNNGSYSGLIFTLDGDGMRTLNVTFTSTTDPNRRAAVISNDAIPLNTWTHVVFTFLIVNGGGITTLYINGIAQTINNTTGGIGGLGTFMNPPSEMTRFTIGCRDSSSPELASCYTGYVDDVRIYTTALTPAFITLLYNSPSQVYLSETPPPFTTSGNGVAWNGDRWVAVGSGGNTILYSTNGLTWIPAASSCFTTAGNGVTWNGTRWVATGVGTIGIGYSSDGSIWTGGIVQDRTNTISPQLTGLAAHHWIQNGVAWKASASTEYLGVHYAYSAFTNNSSSVNTWGSALIYNATSGAYTGSVSTTIQGIGAVLGEWIQLQLSNPLILQSYTYACWGIATLPKEYYIVGSNDGSTWHPLQYVFMTINPCNATFTACSTYIQMNYTGTQTIIGNLAGSGMTTAYSSTTAAYTYFRIIVRSLWPSNTGVAEYNELYFRFGSPFTFNIFDPSRYYYHYTLYNGATITPSVIKPNTPSITLASASSQYLQTANFTPTTAGLSFAFWYKSNASGSWARIFDFGNGPASNNIFCSINGGDSNYLYFEDFYGSVPTNVTLSDISYNDNTWRHVVWTLSHAVAGSATSTWNIYINGVLKTTATAKSYPNPTVTKTISYIGRSNWSADFYYNGNIDDFRIYNSVLTASQVNTIYSGSVYDSTYNTTFSTAGSKIASNNVLSGTVSIQHPIIAVGQGTHSLAYSPDGVQWTGLGTALFTTGYCVCWNGSRWIAGGLGTHTLAYSYDGLRWTGLGATVFSIQTNGIAWNGSLWVAVGSGLHTVAYSYDGLAWLGSVQGTAIFTSCNAVAWNGKQWVAVGTPREGAKSIAYSADGIAWTAMSSTDVFTQGNGICWTGSLWVAVGSGTNSIAYSSDGMSWTGLGNTIFSTSGNGICWNGTRWIAVGTGSAHTIAYSADGITWTGFGKTIFSTAGNGVCWSGSRFIAVGNGSTIGYSQDGIMWYTAVNSIFSTQGNGVAGNSRLGATVSDSQVALSDSLDVVSDTYYNTGYTNFSATIQSQTYRT